jgi:hypothetical protein
MKESNFRSVKIFGIILIIFALVSLIVTFTSCSHKGVLEIKGVMNAEINDGGDIKSIYLPKYKDTTIVPGCEVKYRGRKIYKLK